MDILKKGYGKIKYFLSIIYMIIIQNKNKFIHYDKLVRIIKGINTHPPAFVPLQSRGFLLWTLVC